MYIDAAQVAATDTGLALLYCTLSLGLVTVLLENGGLSGAGAARTQDRRNAEAQVNKYSQLCRLLRCEYRNTNQQHSGVES